MSFTYGFIINNQGYISLSGNVFGARAAIAMSWGLSAPDPLATRRRHTPVRALNRLAALPQAAGAEIPPQRKQHNQPLRS